MSKVLVTGGAGSMGRLVTEKLISKGFIVKIFDLPSANYDGFDPKKTEIIKGDLNNESDLLSGISDVDSVVHLAAILPPLANENEELAKKVNVDGTKKIVEVIQEHNSSIHFIFSSSVSIYGKNTDNKTITEISNPNLVTINVPKIINKFIAEYSIEK